MGKYLVKQERRVFTVNYLHQQFLIDIFLDTSAVANHVRKFPKPCKKMVTPFQKYLRINRSAPSFFNVLSNLSPSHTKIMSSCLVRKGLECDLEKSESIKLSLKRELSDTTPLARDYICKGEDSNFENIGITFSALENIRDLINGLQVPGSYDSFFSEFNKTAYECVANTTL